MSNIEKATDLRDLKAEGYNLIRANEQIMIQLRQINQRIMDLEQGSGGNNALETQQE